MEERAKPISAIVTFLQRFVFRFVFVYLVFYSFPFPVDSFQFTEPIAHPYYAALDYLMMQAGKFIFHIPVTVAFPGFDKVDDSGYGLVFLYCNLVVSILVGLVWTLLSRQRNHDAKLHQWLNVYLRFFLAAYLLGYGFNKVFPSQFQAITASRLTLTVGEQSPMLLAWNFMGYSTTFTRIMGIIEVLAAFLLLFQRTATLGALLAIGTFGFIALLDFCFNVPVRLLASHLLFVSLFLVAEDRNRLLRFFVLNKPVDPSPSKPLFIHTGRSIAFGVLQVLLALCLIYKTGSDGLVAAKTFGIYMPKAPLYGVYKTDYFIRNRDTVLPLQTDSLRWKQVVIDGGSWRQNGIIEFNSDTKLTCLLTTDTINKTIIFHHSDDSTKKFQFHYAQPDTAHLLLKGKWEKDTIEVMMHVFNLDNYLLQREKFRPIYAE
jgi:hypothetical protein